ncbi:MAG: GIY-YIG nuclease family protein [Oscillospiraceae bacterium]|nr:GIY-YIG nuclease family protein [Oscillospiraceae bacterium]
MEKRGYVYILFNRKNGTLYTGVTSDILKRVYQHKNKLNDGFTKKYNIDKLGYYEMHMNIASAIEREKQIKGGSRKSKLALIEGMNPEWKDLYDIMI